MVGLRFMPTNEKGYSSVWCGATSRLAKLLLGAALLVGSCKPREGREEVRERKLMYSSFEELPSWHESPPATLVTDKAHTGRYAIRVDAASPYSPTYRVRLGALSKHRPRRLTVSAWVWVPGSEDDALLVAAITNPTDPDHPIFTKNVFLTDSGPFQKWKKVSRSLDLPREIHADYELVLYLWYGNAQHPVYLDDITLTELW